MPTCPHPKFTFYGSLITRRDEPPYLEGRLLCDDCGQVFDKDDAPDGAVIRDIYGKRMEALEHE